MMSLGADKRLFKKSPAAPDVPAVPEYYDRNQYWPKESLARREALLAKLAVLRG